MILRSVTTGQANENSYKAIQIQITNIDTAYSYVYAYILDILQTIEEF